MVERQLGQEIRHAGGGGGDVDRVVKGEVFIHGLVGRCPGSIFWLGRFE